MDKLIEFTEFLKKIDLLGYRKKYSHIKIVEMNLPKNIQALSLLYEVYWNEKNLLSFEEFYDRYFKEKENVIKEFETKTTMCNDCFSRGLKARIYRTWAGIITQIHAGYVAESVFGQGNVKMSEELDHQDVDIQIHYKGLILNYDVKKIANAGVIGRGHAPKRPIKGEKISIRYEVPNTDLILHPKKKNGKGYKKAYTDFENKYLKTNLLEVFKNGFVVFKPHIFKQKKQEIDKL